MIDCPLSKILLYRHGFTNIFHFRHSFDAKPHQAGGQT